MNVDYLGPEGIDKIRRQPLHESGENHKIGSKKIHILKQGLGPGQARAESSWVDYKSGDSEQFGVLQTPSRVIRADRDDSRRK